MKTHSVDEWAVWDVNRWALSETASSSFSLLFPFPFLGHCSLAESCGVRCGGVLGGPTSSVRTGEGITFSCSPRVELFLLVSFFL